MKMRLIPLVSTLVAPCAAPQPLFKHLNLPHPCKGHKGAVTGNKWTLFYLMWHPSIGDMIFPSKKGLPEEKEERHKKSRIRLEVTGCGGFVFCSHIAERKVQEAAP